MGKLAFVFSGQGAQKIGMAKDFFEYSKNVQKAFDLAEKIRPGTLQQCFYGPQEDLNQTINTQPCLFCADIAAAIVATEKGLVPDCVAGFSLGELCAILYSGILDFKSTFELVTMRAKYMNIAQEEKNGAMLAILRLNVDEVRGICEKFQEVYLANFNSPGQTVVSLRSELVDKVATEVKNRGGMAMKLPVSGAFHSPFMDSASVGIEEYLKNVHFAKPNVPVYSNLTAKPYGNDIGIFIARQINHPVLWQQSVERMIRDGVDIFVEIGVGKTLAKLIKRIDPSKVVLNIENLETLMSTIEFLKVGVGDYDV